MWFLGICFKSGRCMLCENLLDVYLWIMDRIIPCIERFTNVMNISCFVIVILSRHSSKMYLHHTVSRMVHHHSLTSWVTETTDLLTQKLQQRIISLFLSIFMFSTWTVALRRLLYLEYLMYMLLVAEQLHSLNAGQFGFQEFFLTEYIVNTWQCSYWLS